jgi:Ca-activated chloride channel family protein
VILAIPFYGFMAANRLWLLLLIPVLVVAYILIVRRKSQRGMRYTNTTVLGEVLPKQSQWLRHVIVTLSVLSLAALSFAWARPVGMDQVPRERATIVIVVDISWSMTATDVPPSRLDAAKTAAVDFVNSLPDGFNVAVVSLSGSSAVRLSPNQDHSLAVRAIQALTPQDSSAVGDAIMAALTAVSQAPQGADGSSAPAMIVMLSDGANTNGQSPRVAAQQAAQAKVPIYTIGFGTDNGYVDMDGQRYNVPPDHAMLADLARITGGAAYSADNLAELQGAYQKVHTQLGYELVKKEITATAAGLALIFAFTAAAGAVMIGVKFR